MRLPIQVQAIIFRRTEAGHEFLLLRRIPAKGGFWQPVSGGVESTDATLRDAALREVAEETGLRTEDVVRVIEGVHSYVMKDHRIEGLPVQDMTEHVFGVEARAGFAPRFDENVYPEHDEWRWAVLEEALALLKWDGNKEALRRLSRILA